MTHSEKLLNLLLTRGTFGATDSEGAAETGIKPHVYRAVRCALERKGLVGALGERRDDGGSKPRRIYLHAKHVSAEVLAEAAVRRVARAEARAAKRSQPAPPAVGAPTTEPVGATDPLFA
jgi:hypothetical protein